MRRRIFWAILGVTAIVLFGIVLTTAILGRSNVRARLFTQLENDSQLVADLIDESALGPAAARQRSEEQARALLERFGERDERPNGTVIRFGIISDDYAVFAEGVEQLALDLDRLRSGQLQRFDEDVNGNRLIAVARPTTVTGFDGQIVVIAAHPLSRVRLGPIIGDLAVPMLVAALIAAIGARIASGSVVSRLEDLRDATSRLAAGEWSARTTVDGDDEVTELAQTFNDLADFLEEGTARERAFLMSVSHDLRTPLTTVAGYSELLAQSDDDETRRVGQVLDRETQRLRRLVEDVMLLAQLEARQFTIRAEKVDLAAHLSETANRFAHQAANAHIDLVVDAAPTGLVLVDPDRVDQIVANLLDNALRHTPEQGTIALAVTSTPNTVIIAVTDSGPGVEPAEVDRLFERFYVGRRHERPEGSGLGLSIVRQLVAALDGSVRAVLPPLGGLTIEVQLPTNDG